MITEEFDFSKIKVKQEKRTPSPKPRNDETKDAIRDVIDKIVPNLFSSPQKDETPTDNNITNETLEEKKSIEPVKSSNEILTELFKVFNAAPPETLLNDDYLLNKKKKKSHHHDDSNKEKKHKKRKHRKSSSDEEEKNSDLLCDKERSKHKKKKKKKSKKHSKSNESEKTKLINEKKSNKINDINKVIVKTENDEQNGKKNYESEFTISDEEDYQSTLPEDPIVDISIVKKEEQKQSDYSEKITSSSSNNKNISNKLKSTQLKIKLNIKESTILRKVEKAKLNSIENEQNDRNHHDKNYDSSSEITLSDEDEYLNERDDAYLRNYSHDERSKNRERSSIKHISRNSSSSSSRYRHRSRDHFDNSWRRSRSRSRYRKRSRSRSRSRSRNLGIDKKRLLEIARKNAITMFKNGSLPGTVNMTQEAKDKVVMRMRYGGKTVEELTEFCKRLSKGESVNDFSSLSSNEDSDHDKDGNEKVFHHPFVLKDRGPIVMNIKNAVPKPPKTAEQSKAIMQYPVSSGQQHRMIESEWVPVPKKTEAPPTTTTQTAPVTNKPSVPKNVFEKPLPNAQQEPAFVIPSTAGSSTTTVTTTTTTTTTVTETVPSAAITTTHNTIPAQVQAPIINSTPITVPAPAPSLSVAPDYTNKLGSLNKPQPVSNINTPPPLMRTSVPPVAPVAMAVSVEPSPVVPVASNNDSVFPQINQNIDVSSIISQRLNAMRKLQENPTDPEALKMMYDSQKGMTLWATSKFTPGQFTGSTGANVLTPKELTSGQQAWAKRDQLTNSVPVAGGIGMHLLQKMGWRPGEGLGKERKGSLQPLLLELKFDKRGLVANEEDSIRNRIRRRKMQTQQQQTHQQQTHQQQAHQQHVHQQQVHQHSHQHRLQHPPLQPPPEPPTLPPINEVNQFGEVMEGKHPVSLLGEIASKRRWGPPYYEVFEEKGPAHNKKFIFRVTVNDMVYQPSIHCGNKKQAKALAAKYCLQQMGVLPPNS